MSPLNLWRQWDILSADDLNRTPFTLIGAGGIGSYTAMVLANMGVTDLTVYDPDVVEDHNIPSQNYRLADEGRLKVDALAEIVADFTGLHITAIAECFPLDARPTGIVISGLDTMSARSEIWAESLKYNFGVSRYIDARMGAQVGKIFVVNPNDPDDQDHYEATLHSDDNSAADPCTAKAIAYNTSCLAGFIGASVKAIVSGQPVVLEWTFDLVTGLNFSVAAR